MNTRKLLAVLSPRWRNPFPCEGCSQPFVCGATLAGCWCTKYKLSEKMRSELRGKYKGCLCADCLEHFADEDRKRIAMASSFDSR